MCLEDQQVLAHLMHTGSLKYSSAAQAPFIFSETGIYTNRVILTILPLTVASRESTSSAVTPMRLW